MQKWFFRSPASEDVINILQAWRLWLLLTLVGALLGYLFYLVFPPPFRAQATVIVNQNLEQAWPDATTERDLMTYLSRETQKLVHVAWADETLSLVVMEIPSTSLETLRSGALQLSQPADGAWHFWAYDHDPQVASRLASAWARAFYQRSLQGVDVAIQLQSVQTLLQQSPSDELEAHLKELEEKSLGISPFLQITLSQELQLPVRRTYESGTAILVGAGLAWLITTLGLLFMGKKERES